MESLRSSLTGMSRRRRSVLLGCCCALGAGGYLSYRVYTSAAVTRRWRRLCAFFRALGLLVESAAQGSDCAAVLWRDLHAFLLSDRDEVPRSLTQLLKVGKTPEFQTSVALLCRSMTQGVVSSMSEQSPALEDGRDYASALYEEMSAQKEPRRMVGKAGMESAGGDGRLSWRSRRWRSSGETDVALARDAAEDFRREKLVRSGSASRIHIGEADPWSREEDEEARWAAWGTSGRGGYREKASWQSVFAEETAGEGARSKGRSPGQRRGRGFDGPREGLPERLVGKLFSEAGRGFASAVVASAARSLVLAVLEGMQESRRRQEVGGLVQWTTPWAGLDLLQKQAEAGEFVEETRKQGTSAMQNGMIDFFCSSKGRSLVADCIETFIGTAVAVYLDKTRDVNVFEDVFSTVSSPVHREPVKELLTSVCSGAVETFVRASHDVISLGSASGPRRGVSYEAGKGASAGRSGVSRGESSSSSSQAHLSELENLGRGERSEGGGANNHFVSRASSSPPRTPEKSEGDEAALSAAGFTRIAFDHSPESAKKVRPGDDADRMEAIVLPPSSNGKAVVIPSVSVEGSGGWIASVSQTLAVPSNRALVLDVAGTVTSEAIRSVIEVVASKVSLPFRGRRAKETADTEAEGANARPCGGSKVLHVINRTGEFAQATAAKTMVAMTMCLAICLHTLVGPSRVLQLT